MQNYLQHIKLLAKRLFIILFILTVLRVIFFFINKQAFTDLTTINVIYLHFCGIRFDLASLAIINIPFIFFSILPFSFIYNKYYQKALLWLYIVGNTIILVPNFIDLKFYEFEEKRLTFDIFNKEWIGNDFLTLLPAFIADFWYLFLGFFIFLFLLIKIYPKATQLKHHNNKVPAKYFIIKVFVFITISVLTVYTARGGVQLKPISIITAARYTTPANMPLVLNSAFTIMKTLEYDRLDEKKYFTADTVGNIFTPQQQYNNAVCQGKPNVVVIILESFGREYSALLNDTCVGYVPNLDSIMRLGLTFKNGYANGKRSIEALPSILSGLPALMSNSFITSSYEGNSIESLGEVLKTMGYQTSFYHGGKNGTMGFDNYIKLAGIEKYYGLDEYPEPTHYDGFWGIPDELYLQYFCNMVSQMKEPFFTSVFTLSSHHPYKIPEQHQGCFNKGTLINHESIGYADYSLGRFFKCASKKPWFNNTLFVITADHTAQSEGEYYKSNAGRYAIPIIFYKNGQKWENTDTNQVVQQADIMPSVLHFVGYNKPFVAFGSSVFDTTKTTFAVSYINGIYQLIDKNITLSFNGNNIVAIDSLINKQWVNINVTDSIINNYKSHENLLKSVIQQYNHRMITNNLKFKDILSE